MADTLSLKIKSARKGAGLSREALAVALGVSLSTIIRIETGRTQRISTDTLLEIAKATQKPLAYFLNGASE